MEILGPIILFYLFICAVRAEIDVAGGFKNNPALPPAVERELKRGNYFD